MSATIPKKQLEVRKKLQSSFPYYAQHAIKIRTKEQTIAPLVLNKAQRHLVEVIERQLSARGFVRIIILKGRQMGSSTFIESWLYWWVSHRKAQRALVVAHDGPTSTAIFQMTKRIHDGCPDVLRPHTRYSSKKELDFDLLDSSYRVATAGGDGIVRGDTVTAAHLSELAWWPAGSAKDNLSGLMDAIPNKPGTAVFIESTANSFNLFYEQCDQARKGLSLFEFVFLPWFWDNAYREPVPTGFERSPREIELVKLYGLDDEQLMFRRVKIAEKGEELFMQEYPCNADEAFLTSGRPVFHPQRVLDMIQTALKAYPPLPPNMTPEPISRMALEETGAGFEWNKHPHGELKVFHERDPKETYYVGADVGYGVRKDFSVAQVLDSHKRQVAVWRSDRTNEDYFGTVLANLGRYYYDAQIICERNGPGILTNRVLSKDETYPYLYQEVVYDKVNDTETKYVGFMTTEKSKPLVIGELRASIRDGEIEINDGDTLDELRSYIITETGKMEADKGKHDDTVLALALAHHINEGAWTPCVNHDGIYEEIE